MQLNVLTKGSDDGWRVCSECLEEAAVELEEHDEPGRFSAFCLGCLILQLLRLGALFATRREPALSAGAGLPPAS